MEGFLRVVKGVTPDELKRKFGEAAGKSSAKALWEGIGGFPPSFLTKQRKEPLGRGRINNEAHRRAGWAPKRWVKLRRPVFR